MSSELEKAKQELKDEIRFQFISGCKNTNKIREIHKKIAQLK